MNSDSISENTSVMITMIGITRMNLPKTPATNNSGENDQPSLTLSQDDTKWRLQVVQSLYGEETLIDSKTIDRDTVLLRVAGAYLDYRFYFSGDGENWDQLGPVFDGTTLSPYFLRGFNYTGVYVGLYASANGQSTDNHADFDFFRYRPTSPESCSTEP